MVRSAAITDLHIAFSRDQVRGTLRCARAATRLSPPRRAQASKLYVQGRLLEWGDAVYRALFEHHGCAPPDSHAFTPRAESCHALGRCRSVCFVAGSAKRMPSDVLEAVTEVYQKRMGCTMEDALRAVRRLQMQGRYIVEAWS